VRLGRLLLARRRRLRRSRAAILPSWKSGARGRRWRRRSALEIPRGDRAQWLFEAGAASERVDPTEFPARPAAAATARRPSFAVGSAAANRSGAARSGRSGLLRSDLGRRAPTSDVGADLTPPVPPCPPTAAVNHSAAAAPSLSSLARLVELLARLRGCAHATCRASSRLLLRGSPRLARSLARARRAPRAARGGVDGRRRAVDGGSNGVATAFFSCNG